MLWVNDRDTVVLEYTAMYKREREEKSFYKDHHYKSFTESPGYIEDTTFSTCQNNNCRTEHHSLAEYLLVLKTRGKSEILDTRYKNEPHQGSDRILQHFPQREN